MAASHKTIKPVRHAGIASQDHVYISGGVIPEGAPVVFSSGKVIEATDGADGPTTGILGFALNATLAANEDCLVAMAVEGRKFAASYGDNTSSAQTDAGTHALLLADIGRTVGLHKDATSGKWIVATEASGAGLVLALIDKVGATTIDFATSRTFGASGSPTGVTPSTNTPPGRTFQQDPTGSNTGQAQVEFIVKNAASIYV